MSNNNNQTKLEIFKVVNEHFRNAFRLFWQRTNFFFLIDAGLLGFYVSKAFSSESIEALRIVFILSGLGLSILWFLVALSSLKWIDVWRGGKL